MAARAFRNLWGRCSQPVGCSKTVICPETVYHTSRLGLKGSHHHIRKKTPLYNELSLKR